jgi:hypothetical protein
MHKFLYTHTRKHTHIDLRTGANQLKFGFCIVAKVPEGLYHLLEFSFLAVEFDLLFVINVSVAGSVGRYIDI